MSETSVPYLVSGLKTGPNKNTLLLFSDAEYAPPTWEDVRYVITDVLNLSGAKVAKLVGVEARTVRKWTSPPSASNHSQMPYAVWRLLLIAAKLVPAPDVVEFSHF